MNVIDIRQFFHATNPSKSLNISIEADRQLYIDFAPVRGGSIIEEMKDNISFYSPEIPTCTLFTGHIGCGKSTELLRLKQELEHEGFHVVYFESSEDLEMADVDIGDVLLAIARRVSQSLDEITIAEPKGLRQMLKEAARLLQTEFEVTDVEVGVPEGFGMEGLKFSAHEGGEFSLAFGIGKITTRAKNDSGLRERLNQYLGPQKTKLLDTINRELLGAAIAQLKKQGKRGLVVIMD
ncbi:MAG: ATP-binding protein, partial [Leptolyngbyaceae bacterium]|nr:ATP-binding protein [Leptolyngbyaceae bacterium]